LKQLLLTYFLSLYIIVNGGNPYFIQFTHKNDAQTFRPEEYFDPKAIENKKALNLPLYDWYDLPVIPEFIQEVKSKSDSLGYTLRWFNGVTAYLSIDQLNEIQQLSFVQSVSPWLKREIVATSLLDSLGEEVVKNFEVFNWQLNTMGGNVFKSKGLNGSGIRIGVVDVGFSGLKKNKQLSHLFNGQLKDAWDFALNKPLKYQGFSNHGTTVSSFIFGKFDTIYVGHAPQAEALFAKMNSPGKKDAVIEEAWLKSIEWCHQKGAQLVNSSVGYIGKAYKHDMLTGDVCKMSVAGNLAARKGMLIINSAGNERLTKWKRLSFPADADSILTVGAIDCETGVQSDFSSLGPTKDLRVKPNVTAIGNPTWYDGYRLKEVFGTSFSCPLVTGFTACILQNNSSLHPMDLIDTLQKSSSLYPYYDYVHGYGVPRATLYFGIDSVFRGAPSIELEKSPSYLQEAYYTFKYLSNEGTQIFYQILDQKGYIKEYYVVRFGEDSKTGEDYGESPKLYVKNVDKGDKIRVFHRGTFIEKELK
tara:strand:- start:893 stop:2485 length:1593 start_codon:yes stop_codon:yes gene_type:complete